MRDTKRNEYCVQKEAEGEEMLQTANVVRLVAGGDVEWSGRVCRSPIVFDRRRLEGDSWPAMPRIRALIPRRECVELRDYTDLHFENSIRNRKDFASFSGFQTNPMAGLAGVFRDIDIGFVNLEMPLAQSARCVGDFLGETCFADKLAEIGISVVSLANNHALDAEGPGLDQTVAALRKNRIASVGVGFDLQNAREPFVFERYGIRIAILAYTQIPCERTGASFATSSRSGMVPLDPDLVASDIRMCRDNFDHVVLSFHWGIEGSDQVHVRAREIAKAAVKAGASLILGHHPHVPQGIEQIGNAYVVYSMGNLLFSHSHNYWGDNMVIDVRFSRQRIEQLEIIPIAGVGRDLFRPKPLSGARSLKLLRKLAIHSRPLGTRIQINGDRALVVRSGNR